MQTWSCLHDSPNLQPAEQLKNLHLGRPSYFIAASFFHLSSETRGVGAEEGLEPGPLPELPLPEPFPWTLAGAEGASLASLKSSNFLFIRSRLVLLLVGVAESPGPGVRRPGGIPGAAWCPCSSFSRWLSVRASIHKSFLFLSTWRRAAEKVSNESLSSQRRRATSFLKRRSASRALPVQDLEP